MRSSLGCWTLYRWEHCEMMQSVFKTRSKWSRFYLLGRGSVISVRRGRFFCTDRRRGLGDSRYVVVTPVYLQPIVPVVASRHDAVL